MEFYLEGWERFASLPVLGFELEQLVVGPVETWELAEKEPPLHSMWRPHSMNRQFDVFVESAAREI